MIRSDGRLAAVLAVQMGGLLAYNYMGMHVTGNLGAVFRTVLETMRTLFAWLLGLALFYCGTGLGERWNAFSPLQALGFAVLVIGTVVYGRGDERAAWLVRALPVCAQSCVACMWVTVRVCRRCRASVRSRMRRMRRPRRRR
jgi:hypothetical protein